MAFFIFLSILFYLLFNQSLIFLWGGQFQFVYSSSLIILIAVISQIRFSDKQNYYFKLGVLISTLLVIVKITLQQYSQIQTIASLMLIPILHYSNLRQLGNSSKIYIQSLILVFYVAECILAIIEKYLGFSFFSTYNFEVFGYLDYQNNEFRSTSLLGHPLNNALSVSIIMSFIYLSRFNVYFKYIFIILGISALFSFDARAAIIIWMLILTLDIYIKFISKGNLIVSFLIISLLYFVIDYFNLYGRLFYSHLSDGSVNTRINVLKTFDVFNGYDIWFGDATKKDKIISYLGAAGIENSIVALIVDYGLIGLFLIIIFYYKFLKFEFKQLKLNAIVLLLVSFILLGSTNNGLLNPIPLFLFISCLRVADFSPLYLLK